MTVFYSINPNTPIEFLLSSVVVMSEDAKKRLQELTKNSKFRRVDVNKKKKAKIIDAITDSRFKSLLTEDKKPPVDMYGRPINRESLLNYESSSDEEVQEEIPELAKSSEDETEEVLVKECTDRIAIQGLNWNKMTAQDIYTIVSKAIDDHSKSLSSVVVYYSNWGLAHPVEEYKPPKTTDERVLAEIWRKREKRESKRFFAIINFTNKEDCEASFDLLKTVEIGESGNYLDLSVVPDGVDFSEMKVRDEASSTTPDWEPPVAPAPWNNKTKITDNWDGDDADRKKMIDSIWTANDDEFESIDVSALLASGSEDDERASRAELGEIIHELEEEDQADREEEGEEFEISFVSETSKKEAKASSTTEKPAAEKKEKKKKIKEDDEEDQQVVEEILEDNRFTALISQPGFGINAADPKFKKTKAMEKLMGDISKRHQNQDNVDAPSTKQPVTESVVDRIKRNASKTKQL